MYVHRSNRTEALVNELARLVARPAAGPFVPECIVVQGRGMERWLSMELARRLGLWAHPDFPFPRNLIERALAAVLGPQETASRCFAPEILLWSIADLLPRHLGHPEFVSLRTYLHSDERAGRRIELARRIADTFDQYVVYRPDMVLNWERGADTHWQAVLWRALIARHGSHHIAARTQALLTALQRRSVTLEGLPPRVSVFGLSTLAPLYLQVLDALARHLEVHLFLLSPSSQYWADTRSRREQLRALMKEPTFPDAPATDLHFEEGHPLLASLGRVGRDFQQELERTVDYQETGRDLYEDPGTATMLTALQSDILDLRHRGAGAEAPLAFPQADASIRIHSCHGPMREVEVLHDQLLALFENDPTLQPRDVAVLSPAIDTYAPYIDAVFGVGAHRASIPYRIADRAVRATDDVIAAFLTLLTILRGRLTANELVDLLGLIAVRERFGIVAEELDLLRRWVRASGIRWGSDSDHRLAEEQPSITENTWRFGLDRLLLGYATPGDAQHLFAGVLPYDDLEGNEAELLGRLAEFCETLFRFQRALQAPRPLHSWCDNLTHLLAAMVASTRDTAHQHREIQTALTDLAEQARLGQFTEAIDFDSVQTQLAAALERTAPGRAFLTGGVTFCALVPMRSVPFRVVCLLGMNDADFPRTQRPLGFDLVAQKPRPGDRSTRDDDRYLFLEALLSARERLIISYVGQDIRDNTPIPPSVLVSELLDVLQESFGPILDSVLFRHPLQAFSPKYFSGDDSSPLFSYARRNFEGARALCGPLATPQPFLPGPLPLDAVATASAAPDAVTLEELVRFFENPTRAFLQSRLALYLGRDLDGLADREPLELDTLEHWQLGNALLERGLRGGDLRQVLPSVRASGLLPPGTLGGCLLDDVTDEVTPLLDAAGALMSGDQLEALSFDRQLGGARLSGVIRNLWPSGQVRCQFSKLGGRHELGLWIRHLVLNWLRPESCVPVTYLVGRPQNNSAKKRGPVRFRPVDNAAALLCDLLQLYSIGQRTPLLLFEHASRTYAERIDKGPAEALGKARAGFSGGEFSHGDVDDVYVRQLFEGQDPLANDFRFGSGEPPSPGFAEVALRVYRPLLAHREAT